MADFLNHLGTASLWKIDANFQDAVKVNMEYNRKILEFPGSKQEFVFNSNLRPKNFTLSLDSFSKEEESNLLTFFNLQMGRFGRFWIPYPLDNFVLKEDIADNAGAVTCNYVPFLWSEYERIYLFLNTGDWLTFKISSVVSSWLDDETVLGITPNCNRFISVENVVRFGILHLVRFNSDSLKLNYESRDVARVEMEMTEIPHEYEEV